MFGWVAVVMGVSVFWGVSVFCCSVKAGGVSGVDGDSCGTLQPARDDAIINDSKIDNNFIILSSCNE